MIVKPKKKGKKLYLNLALRHTNWGHCKLELIQIKLNEKQIFEERGKPEYPGENFSEQNKLNPHMTPSLGSKPGPHWWEATTLTTMPPQLSKTVVRALVGRRNAKIC